MREAASDARPITGFTHTFYRYPARFSPQFVRTVINAFSRPGEVVFDPYMGGGTTVVEALALGRKAIGCDLNSLAVFVARAKTTVLDAREAEMVRNWACVLVPSMSYHSMTNGVADLVCPQRTRNLSLPRARPAKKLLAQCILALDAFECESAKIFARCVLLNVAQWALNNRKTAPTLDAVRNRIASTTEDMLSGLASLGRQLSKTNASRPTLLHGSSADISGMKPFSEGLKADLVVTSPPYPGIHILYHRWQVDGRKETPAPYWIASCMDGKGSSFYNFAPRGEESEEKYFDESLRTLRAIRQVIKTRGFVVQMIAFSRPRTQLPKYLRNMELAGFREVRDFVDQGKSSFRRIWRHVPSRAWHATLQGHTSSSREVVLVHRAD